MYYNATSSGNYLTALHTPKGVYELIIVYILYDESTYVFLNLSDSFIFLNIKNSKYSKLLME